MVLYQHPHFALQALDHTFYLRYRKSNSTRIQLWCGPRYVCYLEPSMGTTLWFNPLQERP